MFQARERHAFLHRFPNGWPVEEFLKTYLKNKRTYARRQGYLKERNQKEDSSDDNDDDEEQLENDEDAGKGKGKAEGSDENSELEDDMYA